MLVALSGDVYLERGNESISITEPIQALLDSVDIAASAAAFLHNNKIVSESALVPGIDLFYRYMPSDRYIGDAALAQKYNLSAVGAMPVPERLESYVYEVKAIRKLYHICSTVLSERTKTYEALNKCKILHYIIELQDIIDRYADDRTLPYADEEERAVDAGSERSVIYHNIDELPLSQYKQEFRSLEEKLQEKYGFELQKKSLHAKENEKHIPREQLTTVRRWYWDNQYAMKDAVYALTDVPYIGVRSPLSDKKLLASPAKTLAATVKTSLDAHVSAYVEKVDVSINNTTETLNWKTRFLDVALYQWLMIERLSKSELRECAMCGALFSPTTSRELYCGRHNKSQRDYFRRRLEEAK